jgi:hypothetical protein
MIKPNNENKGLFHKNQFQKVSDLAVYFLKTILICSLFELVAFCELLIDNLKIKSKTGISLEQFFYNKLWLFEVRGSAAKIPVKPAANFGLNHPSLKSKIN